MGFSKADFGEQVKYKAVNYYYAGYNDCDFELEITDVEVSPIYYSLAQKWISGNRLKSSISLQSRERRQKQYHGCTDGTKRNRDVAHRLLIFLITNAMT